MPSKDEQRAELEAQLAALDTAPDDDDVDSVDIVDGDKSVRFTGKGSVSKAQRWLKTNFSDLFDPDPDTADDDKDGDDAAEGKKAAAGKPATVKPVHFGRRTG